MEVPSNALSVNHWRSPHLHLHVLGNQVCESHDAAIYLEGQKLQPGAFNYHVNSLMRISRALFERN